MEGDGPVDPVRHNGGMAASTRTIKPDAACLAAVDLAHQAAVEAAGVMGVGDHLGAVAEDDRVVSHFFACPHPGYRGWRWSVTVARASRARLVTVDEVVPLPGEGALGPGLGALGDEDPARRRHLRPADARGRR